MKKNLKKILSTCGLVTATAGVVLATTLPLTLCSNNKGGGNTSIPDPQVITPTGQQAYDATGPVDYQYSFTKPENTKSVTDAVYTITNPTGAASKLSIANGRVTGTLATGDTGSFNVHVASSAFGISGDLPCTIGEELPNPQTITPTGQQTYYVPSTVDYQYSFTQPENTKIIIDAVYTITNPTGAASKLSIADGRVTGTLSAGDTGSFNVHVASLAYGISGNLAISIGAELPNPQTITPTGQKTYSVTGAVDYEYNFAQPDNTKPVADAVYTITNPTGAATGLSISEGNHVIGTLGANATGTFNVHVASPIYGISGDLACTINNISITITTSSIHTSDLVGSDVPVYIGYSDTFGTYISSHNVLLDLNHYANRVGYTGSSFVIEGTIEYGLLIGIDQDVNLLNGAINTTATADETCSIGVLMGSTSPIVGFEYHGILNISSPVTISVNGGTFCFGIYTTYLSNFASINVWGTINASTSITSSHCAGCYTENIKENAEVNFYKTSAMNIDNSCNDGSTIAAVGIFAFGAVGGVCTQGIYNVVLSSEEECTDTTIALGIWLQSVGTHDNDHPVSPPPMLGGVFNVENKNTEDGTDGLAAAAGVKIGSVNVDVDVPAIINVSTSGSAINAVEIVNSIMENSTLTLSGIINMEYNNGSGTLHVIDINIKDNYNSYGSLDVSACVNVNSNTMDTSLIYFSGNSAKQMENFDFSGIFNIKSPRFNFISFLADKAFVWKFNKFLLEGTFLIISEEIFLLIVNSWTVTINDWGKVPIIYSTSAPGNYGSWGASGSVTDASMIFAKSSSVDNLVWLYYLEAGTYASGDITELLDYLDDYIEANKYYISIQALDDLEEIYVALDE